ncbi:MAG: hypothetical protein R3E79_42195 [Caldilineaceae bacterium]
MAENFNVADASVATILKEGSPMALIKGYQKNTWFYGPRAARINRDGTNRPLFALVRNRLHEAGGQGLKTIGGVFGAQLELAVPVPTVAEQKEWQEHIKIVSSISPEGTDSFRFQPLRLRNGKMSILGVDQYVRHPEALVNIPIGASSTIPVSLELNEVGADTFYQAMGNNQAFPLLIYMEFVYDMVVPKCHYKLHANTQKTYEFFSRNVKARAAFFGWVGAQADIAKTREELLTSGAVTIEQVSPPDGFDSESIKKLEERIIDTWVKEVLSKLAEKPQLDPAVAPDPKGFFGGVSVTMKSYQSVQNIDLSVDYQYSVLAEEKYSVTYAFHHQFQALSAADYATDVIDDNELPIVINLTKSPHVHAFSGQYGYVRQDGVYVADDITNVSGAIGGILTGSIQFGVNEEMPETTEIQLSVDWSDPYWEDRTQKIVVQNNASGALHTFSPGNYIAIQRIITDFERYEPGTISVINWKTAIPDYDGNPSKVYSGSLYTVGNGDSGTIQTTDIAYPYPAGHQNDTKLLWDVLITFPNGEVKTKNGEALAAQSMVALLTALM